MKLYDFKFFLVTFFFIKLTLVSGLARVTDPIGGRRGVERKRGREIFVFKELAHVIMGTSKSQGI